MPCAKNLRIVQWMRWFSIGFCPVGSKRRPSLWIGALVFSTLLSSCSQVRPTAQSSSEASGTLQLVANGEDFVRRGFVSKDQWQITLDHVFVTLDQITASQTSLIYGALGRSTGTVTNVPAITLDSPVTVDLAAGDAQAPPIPVAAVSAPTGHYRGLAWRMIPASEGPAKGSSLLLQGTAKRQDQVLPFTLSLNPTLSFRCGEYIGEERKGILRANQTAELEATFHFDHLFGNRAAALDDEVNQGALGFAPLAQLAQAGQVDLNMDQLRTQLSPENAKKLRELLPSLGHVGEGHCEAELE